MVRGKQLPKRKISIGGKSETTATTVKKRAKSGARALKEIRFLQKTTNLLIAKAPFIRLIRELIQDVTGKSDYRITEGAVEALRESAETALVSIFEDSYLLSLHAKRVTLFPQDIKLLLILRNDFSCISNL